MKTGFQICEHNRWLRIIGQQQYFEVIPHSIPHVVAAYKQSLATDENVASPHKQYHNENHSFAGSVACRKYTSS